MPDKTVRRISSLPYEMEVIITQLAIAVVGVIKICVRNHSFLELRELAVRSRISISPVIRKQIRFAVVKSIISREMGASL